MIAIVNSSPLIYLGKLGLLNLLQRLFDQVMTVEVVKQEVLDATTAEYPTLIDAFSNWLEVSDVEESHLSLRLREMMLHKGEVEALVLAYQVNKQRKESVIIIDDLAARDVARALGLRMTGTVGIILRAVKNELLTKHEALGKIRHLVEDTSFRMSTSLYSKVTSVLRYDAE